ncbi:hypothetical protein ABIA33_000119 [Streptacidiphilus sp. MAP12-16]|uniref:M23 family metallopeptidase n=1 Tax=Streptacidiphilus sp. MAP12-16 TaxID=3156300 RepID=UPI0035117AFE
MGTRDRLLFPLRRNALRRSAPQDPTARALAVVFGRQLLSADAFGPELLVRVPLDRLQATVDALRDRHGKLRGVRPQRELYRLQFAQGAELVWARTDTAGRLTTLVTGPGALTARQSAGAVPSQTRLDVVDEVDVVDVANTADAVDAASAGVPAAVAAPTGVGPLAPAAGATAGAAHAPARADASTAPSRAGAAAGASATRATAGATNANASAVGASAAPATAGATNASDSAARATSGATTTPARAAVATTVEAVAELLVPPRPTYPPTIPPLPPPPPAAVASVARAPRAPSAVALQRLTAGYFAAALAAALLPYLTGTATGWLLLTATTPALAWYALRTGPTHALPPWFRVLPLVAVGLAVLAGLRALPAFGPGLPWTMPGLLEIVLFAAVLGLAGWTYRRTRPIQPSPSAHPLTLGPPLRGGCFTLVEGGGPAVNRYAQESLTPGSHRHRRYAVDLVQLGDGPQWRGRRALGLAPATNERYAIFGHPVLSPCDGVVVAAVDGLPDHDPYAPSVEHPEGNHVAIDTGRALIVLCWLRQDSVRVRRGQHVTAGTPVAAVGDSGDGAEPALHLRAETRTSQAAPGGGVGLPFRLTGLRGDPLRGRRLVLPD